MDSVYEKCLCVFFIDGGMGSVYDWAASGDFKKDDSSCEWGNLAPFFDVPSWIAAYTNIDQDTEDVQRAFGIFRRDVAIDSI